MTWYRFFLGNQLHIVVSIPLIRWPDLRAVGGIEGHDRGLPETVDGLPAPCLHQRC